MTPPESFPWPFILACLATVGGFIVLTLRVLALQDEVSKIQRHLADLERRYYELAQTDYDLKDIHRLLYTLLHRDNPPDLK